MTRFVHWEGTDEWRAEAVEVELTDDGVAARGVQLGVDPLPYRLDYELDATDGWRTRSLGATAAGDGWGRTLWLERSAEGVWSLEVGAHGEAALDEPGGPADALAEALDCDLGFSPLTNLMPIRREGLHRRAGASDHVMAWVAVPDLRVFASAQRYEHVRSTGDEAIVRFVDRGLFEGFEAELRLDRDGLIKEYPGLARRAGTAAR
jgi:hypothetical protein